MLRWSKLIALFARRSNEEYSKSLVYRCSCVNEADCGSLLLQSLPHLRDGFSRALVARLKMPHVASALSPEESEVSRYFSQSPQSCNADPLPGYNQGAADAITELKSFFPKRPLAKGEPLFVYYSGTDVSARFVIKNEDASNFNLGASHNAVLTRQLFLSYFSDVGVISEELKQSVARGFAGEPR